jgi:GT2 family glycosyltransferase
LSYINSDKAIEEKIADYQRRAAVGDFKELRKNYMDLWYERRKSGTLWGKNVHPILGYTPHELSQTPSGTLPAALKYSRFGVLSQVISIIIVTYNSGHCLMDMLRSLVQFKTGYETEVILVDNLSKDCAYLKRAEAFLQDNGIKVITFLLHENHMFTMAANYGMKHASGFWRLLVNPDVKFIHDGWFQKLVDASNDLKAGIIAPKMIYENGTIHFGGGIKIQDKYFHVARDEKDVGQVDEAKYTEWVTGACFLIRLDVYLALGGLDEQYKHYGSDNKYCELARRSGFNVAYAGKQSTIIHLCGKSCK